MRFPIDVAFCDRYGFVLHKPHARSRGASRVRVALVLRDRGARGQLRTLEAANPATSSRSRADPDRSDEADLATQSLQTCFSCNSTRLSISPADRALRDRSSTARGARPRHECRAGRLGGCQASCAALPARRLDPVGRCVARCRWSSRRYPHVPYSRQPHPDETYRRRPVGPNGSYPQVLPGPSQSLEAHPRHNNDRPHGPLLRHHPHLLRQRRPAYRSRVHDGGG